jgi:cell filamentation protein
MDPYLYPGTDVLKNLRGFRDPALLDRFEAGAAARRLVELTKAPVKGRFDTAHLREIHRRIFQDVYAWAGQFRTVNISKDGHLFGAASFVEQALADVLHRLSSEKHMQGSNLDTFIDRAGFYLGEINAAHPFREGNGRTQREFIREIGLKAGFAIDWSRITREEMIEASRTSFLAGDSSGLRTLIRKCIG